MASFSYDSSDYLDDPEKKRFLNEKLFREVARRYDALTRVLSFGRDAVWKRRLVARLPEHEAPVCLDIACGTGDLAKLVFEKYRGSRLIALDLTYPMLALAKNRLHPDDILWSVQDMMQMAVESGSVDILTGGYALRNSPDLVRTIGEINRVLRPGATAAFLDFSKPPSRLLQFIEYWVLFLWGSLWGFLIYGSGEICAYIAKSLSRFPDSAELRALFLEQGFEVIVWEKYFLGVSSAIVVRKKKWN